MPIAPSPRLPPIPQPRRTAALPGPQAAPAPVAVAPPPPPPAPVATPTRDVGSDYEQQNPAFFYPAVCRIAAALTPNIVHDKDNEAAEKAAYIVAAFLDSGTVPPKYKAPKIARLMHAILEAEAVEAARTGSTLAYAQIGVSAHHGTPHAASSLGAKGEVTGYVNEQLHVVTVGVKAPAPMNERQKQMADERLKNVAKEHGGTLPNRAEADRLNADSLARFLDISEVVRSVALDATVAHLTQRPTITGGADTAKEALDIAVFEMDRALRILSAANLPVQSTQTLLTQTDMTQEQWEALRPWTFPWPLCALAMAAEAAIVDEPRQEEPAPEESA